MGSLKGRSQAIDQTSRNANCRTRVVGYEVLGGHDTRIIARRLCPMGPDGGEMSGDMIV
jgi:hypothetical protein